MKERFAELLRQAEDAFANGRLETAVELATSAEKLAGRHDEPDLADRAFCNRCAFLVELGRGGEQIPRLKQILLRSRDTKNRFLAAYYTAVAFDIEDDLERAQSYATRALELSEKIDEPAFRAHCANLSGTLAVRSSRFAEAEAAYSAALEAHRSLDGYHNVGEAQTRSNLGYVMMSTDRLVQGLELCDQARASMESLGAVQNLHETLQDLCYGYILDDHLDEAHACGERALDLALEHDDALVVKNCLFLLSEAAVRRGDAFGARRYLRELAAYYPEVAVSEEIIDVFLTTDLTTVVNLRG